MRKLFLLLSITLLLPVLATALTSKELARSINLAGKERMLTQQMAKEALLIAQNVQKEENRKALNSSSERFEKVLHGLIEGDETLGLKPCKKGDVQKRLQKVDQLWKTFKPHIDNILQKHATVRDYEAIRNQNIPLLEAMHDVVLALVAQSREKNSLRSQSINLSGKERMLTQKMAKALLENDTESLKATAKEFDTILNGLIHGNKQLHLEAAKLPKIQKALKEAQKKWKGIQERLFRPAQSSSFRYETVQRLDTLLPLMDAITKRYEKSLHRQKQALALNRLVQNYMQQQQDRKHAINIAGKERMLTQKMTKEALLVTLGINTETNRALLRKTAEQYNRALQGFLQGSKTLQLEKVEKPDTKTFIQKRVMPAWDPFYEKISVILKSDKKEPNALAYLVAHNEALLHLSDQLVQKLKSDAGEQNFMEAVREQIVDIAGRQRMLTQKMTKEKLLILADIQKAKYQKSLRESIGAFDRTLHDLRHGNPARKIPKPTDAALIAQLKEVEKVWQRLKPLYEKAHPDNKELAVIVSQNPLLLQEMNKAVTLYETLADL